MQTPEGPMFCPGCPNTGNFVGTVSVVQMKIATDDKQRSVDYDRPEPEGSIETFAYFVDEDGLATTRMGFTKHYGRFSELKRDKINPEQDQERLTEQSEKIVERIGKCVGRTATMDLSKGNGSLDTKCPAVNEQVLKHLTDNKDPR